MIEQVPATRMAVESVQVDIHQDQWGSWTVRVNHRRIGDQWTPDTRQTTFRVEWEDVGLVTAVRINKLLSQATDELSAQLELF